jgi:exosome complex RNA-binding protein Rrp42 (RNase PH superfamily)
MQVIQMDGNPLDVCSMASYVAMQKLKIPKTIQTIGKNSLSQVLWDFDIVSDPSEAVTYNFRNIPIIVSIAKIGRSLIIYAVNDEQDASTSITCVGINRFEECSLMSVLKSGSFGFEDWPIMLQVSLLQPIPWIL